ncbi:glycoside hydrolase family 31 protein [Hungatella hathewayi]|uniref:glycoside hydrolase family 31 protein n=1 Tax=Hungatella hathewayi TaxID=154046 RepID=UPI0035622C53
MRDIFKVKTNPVVIGENIVAGTCYRISVLTEGLIRLEYRKDGCFEDRPTQMAWNRDFKPADYRLIKTEDGIEIITKRVHIIYNEQEFSRHGLSIQVLGNLSAYHSIWHYSEDIHDLKGTARTLDEVDGETKLESGVLSRFGYSVIDDSRSMILTEDGWVEARKGEGEDLYFFGYGHDYLDCLKDFYYLTGRTPMLPRFALGNWWSRYYKYTEESYLELMDRFEREAIPFTVAVIDMDWHLVDVDPKYGSGWTGYTWNREFFPDPERFLQTLHRRGMRTTLNVHPADGVQAYEEMYEDMAKDLGVDWENEDPVCFNITDPDFLEAYFQYLHHPYEKMGVDFWWIDWQQGGNSRIPGLDPLWMLNHYHFLDSGREGKRPMTFSRYAGPGSHRYPVGFSGDTITTWDSLEFQPYFTANASNIGYGWWSHDIGGHMRGYKDDEMEARWTQFGVFSPIMRLHSSCSEFNGKEPWRFKKETETVMGDFLRLRHRLMPYLYTMNYRASCMAEPLVMPMYYKHPEAPAAYEVANQYYFGSEMIVAPVTAPRIGQINEAKVRVWIPEGTCIDFFNHMVYEGGRVMELYRPLEAIPVLVKAGGVIPMTDNIGAVDVTANPETLRIRIFGGADGEFTLYEDDNETCDYEQGVCVTTDMKFDWEGEKQTFTIASAVGAVELIPEKRNYILEFTAVTDAECSVTLNGGETACRKSYDADRRTLTLEIDQVSTAKTLVVRFETDMKLSENPVEKLAFEFLNQAETTFETKEMLFRRIREGKSLKVFLSELQAMEIDGEIKGALVEILTA